MSALSRGSSPRWPPNGPAWSCGQPAAECTVMQCASECTQILACAGHLSVWENLQRIMKVDTPPVDERWPALGPTHKRGVKRGVERGVASVAALVRGRCGRTRGRKRGDLGGGGLCVCRVQRAFEPTNGARRTQVVQGDGGGQWLVQGACAGRGFSARRGARACVGEAATPRFQVVDGSPDRVGHLGQVVRKGLLCRHLHL